MNDTLTDDILTVQSLTERLKKGEDVTLEEARYIANTVKNKFFALNPDFSAFDPKLPFMYASDIERNPHIPYITTRQPKDLVSWMLKNGYINEKTAEKLLQAGSESWISCQEIDIIEVCYEFARYCREYLEVREILEDGLWTDVIR